MRKEKQYLLDEIEDKIESSHAFIVTRYGALSPEKSWKLNTELLKSDSFYEVVKKRVFAKAMKEKGIEIDLSDIQGNIGVVFIEGDSAASTKTLYQFNKDENCFEVIKGSYSGKLYNSNDVEALSKLPNKEVMRAEFLGLLEAPSSQTLAVMEAILTSVIHCLNNKVNK